MNIYEESVNLHRKLGGKLSVDLKHPIETKHDLSLVYTPGVAAVCREIHKNPKLVYDLTIKKNSVAVITDGSAVLGLGNIGPEAALPVMEGKANLFKAYAGIDAYPICLNTQNNIEIINTIRFIAPGFGGINLEDFAAPRCFEIENSLQDIGIPVFHDDQHGTAIVILGALLNACKISGKKMEDLKVVINGSGAAGIAITEMLLCVGHNPALCESVKEVIICDSKGIISKDRKDITNNPKKVELSKITNKLNINGTLKEAIVAADIFIGVSIEGALSKEMVKSMAEKPIIFAMANPVPEIMPEEAYAAGAFIVGTGRSDFPNQVNNVLAFPGIFRGAFDGGATVITREMKLAAGYALANAIKDPTVDKIIPSPLEKHTAYEVAAAVKKAWLNR